MNTEDTALFYSRKEFLKGFRQILQFASFFPTFVKLTDTYLFRGRAG